MGRKRKRTAEEWASHLQGEIAYCLNCQPRDDGDYVWVFGVKNSMDLFLYEHEVPERQHEEVASLLVCGNCGTELDLGSDIGTKCEAERTADRRWVQWNSTLEDQLTDFVKFLERHPLLGGTHAFGGELAKSMGMFPAMARLNERWWRARPATPAVPSDPEMGPPPLPPRVEGRYSHHGQRVFYLASDQTSAASETLKETESWAWVQEYRVSGVGRILDLRHAYLRDDFEDEAIPLIAAGLKWSGLHMRAAGESEWKPEYFLTRYIADCARAHGFVGIAFESEKHFGTNLVLFDWTDEQVTPNGEPVMFQLTNRRKRYNPDLPSAEF